jgi:hypothetical protein
MNAPPLVRPVALIAAGVAALAMPSVDPAPEEAGRESVTHEGTVN